MKVLIVLAFVAVCAAFPGGKKPVGSFPGGIGDPTHGLGDLDGFTSQLKVLLQKPDLAAIKTLCIGNKKNPLASGVLAIFNSGSSDEDILKKIGELCSNKKGGGKDEGDNGKGKGGDTGKGKGDGQDGGDKGKGKGAGKGEGNNGKGGEKGKE